ncbi:MAG: hypothetical protein LV473_15460 [Nitrospira sp.]|nr:hypothetical protein [Nitrospira sp.]
MLGELQALHRLQTSVEGGGVRLIAVDLPVAKGAPPGRRWTASRNSSKRIVKNLRPRPSAARVRYRDHQWPGSSTQPVHWHGPAGHNELGIAAMLRHATTVW